MTRPAVRLTLALTICTVGLAACGDDDGDDKAPATTSGGSGAQKIVIKTRMNIPTGEIVAGSSIGGAPFCVGGKVRDRSSDDADVGGVDRTVRCPDGTVRIGFSPQEPQGGMQRGPWKIISGTGAYQGLQGSGAMQVEFEPGSDTKGRETFTGTVTR